MAECTKGATIMTLSLYNGNNSAVLIVIVLCKEQHLQPAWTPFGNDVTYQQHAMLVSKSTKRSILTATGPSNM